MKHIFGSFFLLATCALAQYSAIPSSSYPALDNIINGKITWTSQAGVPRGACTMGKDINTNTSTGDLYWCGGANAWTLKGGAALGLIVDASAALYGGNLATVLAAAGNNSTIMLPQNLVMGVGSQVTVSGNNIKFLCMPGSSIAKTGNVDQYVYVTGTGVTFDGCTFNGVNFTGAGLSIAGTSVKVLHSTVENNQGVGIGVFGATDTLMDDVTVIGNTNTAIFGQDNINGIKIVNSLIDDTAASANPAAEGVALHTSTSGAYLTNVDISHNRFKHSAGTFAVEVGGFGGLPGAQVSVNNNDFTFSANTAGAISFNGCLGCDASHNQINFGAYAATIEGIEMVQSHQSTAAFNHITTTNVTPNSGIDCDATKDCKVVGNVLTGTNGIYVGSSNTASGSDNAVVDGNTLLAGGNITIRCNFAGCTSNNAVIANNHITGLGVGTQGDCIELRADVGVVNFAKVINNTMTGCTSGLNNPNGARVDHTFTAGNTASPGVNLYAAYPIGTNSTSMDSGYGLQLVTSDSTNYASWGLASSVSGATWYDRVSAATSGVNGDGVVGGDKYILAADGSLYLTYDPAFLRVARPIIPTRGTVATGAYYIGACTSANDGAWAYVTDLNSRSPGATATPGGGSVHGSVWCDGSASAWIQ